MSTSGATSVAHEDNYVPEVTCERRSQRNIQAGPGRIDEAEEEVTMAEWAQRTSRKRPVLMS